MGIPISVKPPCVAYLSQPPKKVSSVAPAPLSTQASKVPSTLALSKVHASHVGRPTPPTAAVLYLDRHGLFWSFESSQFFSLMAIGLGYLARKWHLIHRWWTTKDSSLTGGPVFKPQPVGLILLPLLICWGEPPLVQQGTSTGTAGCAPKNLRSALQPSSGVGSP